MYEAIKLYTDIDNATLGLEVGNVDVDYTGWTSGVEHMQAKTEDELWQMLGCPDGHIKFFNDFLDPSAILEPRDGEEWVKYIKDPNSDKLPCRPKWHQLVGIYMLLDAAFDGKPMMLMDEVGIGKTMQIFALIAWLGWFHEFYESKKYFPGTFST